MLQQFWTLFLFIAVSRFSQSSADRVDITTDYLPDSFPNSSYCIPVTTGLCNLRSAFSACGQLLSSTGESCRIVLPTGASVPLNTTAWGDLKILNGYDITIEGANTTVYQNGTVPEIPEIYTDGFPYVTGTLTDTASDTQNYATAYTEGCYGDLLVFQSCSQNASIPDNIDTLLKLYIANSSTMVASNDDACGVGSLIAFEVVTKGCTVYGTLQLLCRVCALGLGLGD